MKRDVVLRLALPLAALVGTLGAPACRAAESMADVVRSARSVAEKAEACSYAFSDLGSSIRAAHVDPGSMPVSLAHEDLQAAEDLDVTALVFDHVSRELDVSPARTNAIERIRQSMIGTASVDDDRHTQAVEFDKQAIQLCTPIYTELKQRGTVTRTEENIFRKIVQDSIKKQ